MSPGEDSVVDSGATSNIIKDREMFVSLDENFIGSVRNAKFSEAKLLGKGELRFRAKNEKGEVTIIELKDFLYVPEKSRNLPILSKMKKAGAEVVFGMRVVCLSGKWFSLPITREKWSF